MNKILVMLGCFVFVSAFGGCGRQGGKISSQPQLQSKTQEDVSPKVWDGEPPANDALPDFFGDQSEKSAFPESMVGVWEVVVDEYSGSKWGIKFEPDGSINKITHSVVGPVNVTEGGVDAGTEEAYYIFIMGPCEAMYIPETRMIKVEIIVDYFIVKLPAGELEGRMEDYFEGPVSEDGMIWTASWRHFSWLKGAAPPAPNPPGIQLVLKKMKIE
jgi:hypothetical protein